MFLALGMVALAVMFGCGVNARVSPTLQIIKASVNYPF
jgi:hypothetical protein